MTTRIENEEINPTEAVLNRKAFVTFVDTRAGKDTWKDRRFMVL